MSQIKWEDLPQEIKNKMLDEQVSQGNEIVFINSTSAGGFDDGFNWNESPDGNTFWDSIITHGEIQTFYDKYPKSEVRPIDESTPTTSPEPTQLPITGSHFVIGNGKVLLVSDYDIAMRYAEDWLGKNANQSLVIAAQVTKLTSKVIIERS